LSLLGCFGIDPGEYWRKNLQTYEISDYVKTIDYKNFDWLLVTNEEKIILIFKYQASFEFFLRDQNGIGKLLSYDDNENHFKYEEFDKWTSDRLATIEDFILKWPDQYTEPIVLKLSNKPVVAFMIKNQFQYGVTSFGGFSAYIDIEKLLSEFTEIDEIWVDDGKNGIAYDCKLKKFVTEKFGYEIDQLFGFSVIYRGKDLNFIKKSLDHK